MTDIVERLRSFEALDIGKGQAESIEDLMNYAADEIERLREEVERVTGLFFQAINLAQRGADHLQSFGTEIKDILS